MSRISFFQDVLASVFEQGKIFRSERDKRDILDLCDVLMSEQGEVAGTKVAAAVLAKYETLDEEQKLQFFRKLADDYDLEPDAVVSASQEYAKERSPKALRRLIESGARCY